MTAGRCFFILLRRGLSAGGLAHARPSSRRAPPRPAPPREQNWVSRRKQQKLYGHPYLTWSGRHGTHQTEDDRAWNTRVRACARVRGPVGCKWFRVRANERNNAK